MFWTPHPVLKREDRLRKHPFAGFGTVMEDIKRTSYTKNQPFLQTAVIRQGKTVAFLYCGSLRLRIKETLVVTTTLRQIEKQEQVYFKYLIIDPRCFSIDLILYQLLLLFLQYPSSWSLAWLSLQPSSSSEPGFNLLSIWDVNLLSLLPVPVIHQGFCSVCWRCCLDSWLSTHMYSHFHNYAPPPHWTSRESYHLQPK